MVTRVVVHCSDSFQLSEGNVLTWPHSISFLYFQDIFDNAKNVVKHESISLSGFLFRAARKCLTILLRVQLLSGFLLMSRTIDPKRADEAKSLVIDIYIYISLKFSNSSARPEAVGSRKIWF